MSSNILIVTWNFIVVKLIVIKIKDCAYDFRRCCNNGWMACVSIKELCNVFIQDLNEAKTPFSHGDLIIKEDLFLRVGPCLDWSCTEGN